MEDRPGVVAALRAAGCVFAEDEARLLIAEARGPDELVAMVERRISGIPLEHVLGWAEFHGLRIAVDPGLFVPRRRTEFLADQAIAIAARVPDRAPIIVDLCCGTGAVSAALVAALDRVETHSVDIDPAEVRCARRNLPGQAVYEGDLYQPLPTGLRGRVRVLVANAPYVPSDAVALMPPEAREHESLVALDGGPDGLDIVRRVITAAPDWLAPGGHLLVETSVRQAPLAVEAATGNGMTARVTSSEERGGTVVIATR